MDAAAAAVDHRGVVRRASLLVLLVVTALAGQAASAVAAGTPSPGAATLVDRIDVTS